MGHLGHSATLCLGAGPQYPHEVCAAGRRVPLGETQVGGQLPVPPSAFQGEGRSGGPADRCGRGRLPARGLLGCRGPHLLPLAQSVVGGLLSREEDCSLLLSQFREYLEHDDIRYHTMQAASDTVARVANGHPEVSWPARTWGKGGLWSRGLRPGVCRYLSPSGATPSRCCQP